MKKKSIFLFLLLVTILNMFACDRTERAETIDNSDFVLTEKQERTSQNNSPVFDPEVLSAVYEFLDDNAGRFGDINIAKYYIYDMTDDAKEELIILAGTTKEDTVLLFYEYINGEFIDVGSIDAPNCKVCADSLLSGVNVHYVDQNGEKTKFVAISDGQLVERLLSENRGFNGDYAELDTCKHIDFFAINDYDFLKGIKQTVPTIYEETEQYIDFSIGVIGSSGSKFIQECNYDGILTPEVDSSFFDNGETTNTLKKDGTEKYYSLFRTDTTIAVRNDKFVGFSQSVRSQDAQNVFQLLEKFQYNKLLDYKPEIIRISRGYYYLKWTVKNAIVVVTASFGGDDTTNWKRALPNTIRVFEK